MITDANTASITGTKQFEHLVSTGGYIITAAGRPLIQDNVHEPFIPASTIKIATSLAALEILGPNYRYKTAFYLSDDAVLCIKGYGDPSLTSEAIEEIVLALKKRSIRSISAIVLDDTLFQNAESNDWGGNSDNPYDAPNSALAVNYNSIALRKHGNGTITTGEKQTPYIPLMDEIGQHLKPGLHRVNVAAFSRPSQINHSLRYAGQLFKAILLREGIEVRGSFRKGQIDAKSQPIYTYSNPKTLEDVIRECLKYSNNFIANQLFLTAGLVRYGYPATWKKARRTMNEFLSESLGLSANSYSIWEGSGLSRKNAVTPAFLAAVLEVFKPYGFLLPKNSHGFIKSGTMSDVYSYAGYFSSQERLDPFVILLNQNRNTREELLVKLHRLYQEYVGDRQSRPFGNAN
ncbi:MAG: D-alanyl-D-alanine carboxypeptidase/D-alanyl-D-alanine-endopeptidase [Desulfobacterales bacterium]|nr:D-alanyl-D-alanine carboxypeptidase/D-alanyl-D-alanine-endopeptidase [Desulfobacterales bacterium]